MPAEPADGILQALSDLESRFAGLKKAHEQNAQKTAELLAREKELIARDEKLREFEELLRRKQEELKQLAQSTAEQRVALDAARARTESERREIDEAKAQVEATKHELEAARAKAEAEQLEVEESRSQAAALQKELAAERAKTDAERRQVAQSRAEAEAQRRELDAARERSELERLELDEAREHAETARRELDAARVSSENAQRELEEARELAEADRRELDAVRARTLAEQNELKETRARLEREASLVKSAQQALAAEKEALTRQAKDASQKASQDADAAVKQWRTRAEAAEAKAREETAARARAEADLAAAREESKKLAARTSGDDAALKRELGDREQTIAALNAEVTRSRNVIQSLQSQLQQATSSRAPAADGSLEAAVAERLRRRRERLAVYKDMLQTQARKIVAAQTALQKRHAECEQVLGARARLAQLSADLAKKEKRIASAKARTGAFGAMACFAITLAVLAGLSWEVAKRIVPGTYIATAVLEADPRGRTPSDAELANWQEFHEGLVSDTRLLETAAERLRRRGIATLGSAAELRARMKQDLYVQSGEDGSLTLELKGEGADRTAMILDTFVTAMKSVSDAARGHRADDLTAVIAQQATAGERPLKDDRLRWASSMLAGSTLAVSMMGLLVWSRLSRSKRKFEEDHAIEAALAEVDWPADQPRK